MKSFRPFPAKTRLHQLVWSSCGQCHRRRRRSTDRDNLYQLLDTRYEEVKTVWEDRFQKAYGFWRGFADKAVARYLDRGRSEVELPRFRCEDCREEVLLTFSCRARGLCPSCDAKRAAAFAAFLHDEVVEDVPHATWVTRPRKPQLRTLHCKSPSFSSTKSALRRRWG